MRVRITTAVIVIIAAVGCLAYQRAPRIVRADAGCDATSLNGANITGSAKPQIIPVPAVKLSG